MKLHYSLNWAYAHNRPRATAAFKATAEDFEVHEIMNEGFSGEGEHHLLRVEKRGLNTEDVVKALARALNISAKLISYAGLKDRQALATQWISIHLPGKDIPPIESLSGAGWRVLEYTRHLKKLRPGYLAGNRFRIWLRDVTDLEDLMQRLTLVKTTGVPNYFGDQRFGREANNLSNAAAMLLGQLRVKDRFLKGIYLSAARSWLFNLILSQRVADQSWNKALAGDVMQLAGSHSIFSIDAAADEIGQRILHKDLSPASPLPGRGKGMVSGAALALIEAVCRPWQDWIQALAQQGVEEAWRANILHVESLEYQQSGKDLILAFTLPAGAYATTLLREIVNC